jgi:nucleoside-diphosphate-sugar epimerase
MRVFVAGASGVVGRRLVPMLLDDGHEVTAVARTPARAAALRAAGARPAQLDLFDREAVRKAAAGHDAVVNLATHIPRSSTRMLLPGTWRENDRIRRVASANLAEAAIAAGAGRFIQESFAPVYPGRGAQWIEEDTPLAPARFNRSILDAERSAERFALGGGAGVVLRFAGFYGPDAFQTRDMMRMVRKGWAPLPGAAEAYVSWLSHDDAARAARAALELPSGAYNVVDDEPLTRREFFVWLAHELGVAPPEPMPAWTARLLGSIGELLGRSLRISNRKLRRAAGWAPAYPSVRRGWGAILDLPRSRCAGFRLEERR